MVSRRLVVGLLLLSVSSVPGAQTPIRLPADPANYGKALKSPTAARVIGIVPGAGHVYASEADHGIAYMGGVVGILFLGLLSTATDECADCPQDQFPMTVAVATAGLWGWSIYDAGRAAQRTNQKRTGLVSAFVQPTFIPAEGNGRDRAGVRLGLSIR